jgi:hypothetical protein
MSGSLAAANTPAARSAALETLSEAHVAVEYALMLGLSRDEAVAFLQHAAGQRPALTHIGAKPGHEPRRARARAARAAARAGAVVSALTNFLPPVPGAPRRAVWDELAAQNAEFFRQHQQQVAHRVRAARRPARGRPASRP